MFLLQRSYAEASSSKLTLNVCIRCASIMKKRREFKLHDPSASRINKLRTARRENKSAYPLPAPPNLSPGNSGRWENLSADEMTELRFEALKAAKRREHERLKNSKFVDHVIVDLRGGKGGSGAVAFHRDMHIERGPPSGGNGGEGGDITIVADPSVTTLAAIKKIMNGNNGEHGKGAYQSSPKAPDKVIRVPVGTVVRQVKKFHNPRPKTDEEIAEWQENNFIFHPSRTDAKDAERHFKRAVIQVLNSYKREEQYKHRIKGTSEEVLPISMDLDIATPEDSPRLILANGGRGGKGNPHFGVPGLFASKGSLGERVILELELKMVSDVGFVGLPNAGKSTLLRCLTNATPIVAGYAFTTLNPQIGQVVLSVGEGENDIALHTNHTGDIQESLTWSNRSNGASASTWTAGSALETQKGKHDDKASDERKVSVKKRAIETLRFTVADNPGLIAEASQNKGLGHAFLRSIERCHLLVYVIDISSEKPHEDYKTLQTELELYKENLSGKATVIVANKADTVDAVTGKARIQMLRDVAPNVEIVTISAKNRGNILQVAKVLGYKMATIRSKLELDRQKEVTKPKILVNKAVM